MAKVWHLGVIGALLLAVVPSTSHASISLGSLAGGVVNELEDDDFEMLINAGGSVLAPGADTTLDVGDFVGGIIRITSLRVPPGGPQQATATDTEATFTAVFLQKITSVTISAGGLLDGNNDVNLRFGAPTAADWAAVFAGTGAALPTGVGTTAIVFQDPDNIDQTLPLAAAFGTPDGAMAWEIGFLGSPGELWTSNVDTDDILTQFGISTGNFTANLNVTAYGIGPLLGPQPVVGGFADILLRNGSLGSPAPGSSFPVSSDVDILLAPVVPEPATLLAWLGLMAVGGTLTARRFF